MVSGGTGTGGSFVPVQGRLVDTRNGTGGYSTPQPSSGWRAYPVAGVAGIPATGVASVAVTVTTVAAAAAGNLGLASNTALPPSGTPATFLVWNAGDTVSNTGIVDVGTDGKIAVKGTSSVNIIIDVQGYFLVGNGSPAPGGYVSAGDTRIVDTRSNYGVPGPVTTGSTATVQVTGAGGIPASATAVYANITVMTSSAVDGYITPYATGAGRPGTPWNYGGSNTVGYTSSTALGGTVDLNSSGQFSLYVGATGGSVQILVDIEPSTSGFYPLAGRVLDTRVSPAVALPANSVTTLQLAGAHGIPAASASLAGVALNLEAINTSSSNGYLKMWPSDVSEPSGSVINYDPTTEQSNLTMIRPGLTDGKIFIRNSGPSINLVIDAEGYFTNPSVLPVAIGPNDGGSGDRTAQALISRTLTDRISAKVNPTNGNLLITQALLSLTGIGQSASVALRYNAKNDARPTLNVGLFEAQLYRNGSTGTVTHTGPDGAAYIFVPTGNSYTDLAGRAVFSYNDGGTPAQNSPAGINANLVRVGATYGPGTEYDLTFHPSQAVNVYVDDGSNITLNSSQDVTGHHHITYTYARGALTTITDTQGRTTSFAYTDPSNLTQPSTITDNSLGRVITLTYGGPQGALSKIVDATGTQTLFAYNTAGKLSSLTDGRGTVTAFTYNLTSVTSPTGSDSVAGRTMNHQYTSSPSGPGSSYTTADYRPTTATDTQGHQTATAYNPWGEAITISTPLAADGVTPEGGVLHCWTAAATGAGCATPPAASATATATTATATATKPAAATPTATTTNSPPHRRHPDLRRHHQQRTHPSRIHHVQQQHPGLGVSRHQSGRVCQVFGATDFFLLGTLQFQPADRRPSMVISSAFFRAAFQ